MGAPCDPWTWTPQRERAAELLSGSEGELTNDQIAETVGVTRDTLQIWKRIPEFRARVQDHLDAVRKEIAERGLAKRANRIYAKMARAAALRGLIRSRGRHDSYANAPGATIEQKGIQGKKLKSLGSGDSATIIEEYEVDTATLAELRALEVEIATELGEWKTKVDLSAKIEAIPTELAELAALMTPEELDDLEKRYAAKHGSPPEPA